MEATIQRAEFTAAYSGAPRSYLRRPATLDGEDLRVMEVIDSGAGPIVMTLVDRQQSAG